MKRIRKIILIGLIGGIFIMSGCLKVGKSKEEIVKEALKAKYNEEFIVRSISNLSGGMDAIVSPENNPEIVFSARINDDGSYVFDDYSKRYIAKVLDGLFNEELKKFFPGSYANTRVNVSILDGNSDFRNITIDNIGNYIDMSDGVSKSIYLDIFLNADNGTSGKFKDEYEFFSSIMQQHSLDLSLTIHFFWVDDLVINRVRDYYKENIIWNEYFESQVLGVEEYETGTVGADSEERIGNPPNIGMSFNNNENTINLNEYIRERKIIENGSIQ